MKTLREECEEIVRMAREQIIEDIRLNFNAKLALNDNGTWKATWKVHGARGTSVKWTGPETEIAQAMVNIKTAWVKDALVRLYKRGDHAIERRSILGEIRRGRQNVSARFLSPILGSLKRSKFICYGPAGPGFYELDAKGLAAVRTKMDGK